MVKTLKGILSICLILFFCSVSVFAQLSAVPQTLDIDATIPSSLVLQLSAPTLTWTSIPAVWPGSPAWYDSETCDLTATVNIAPGNTAQLFYKKVTYFENESDPLKTILGTDSKIIGISGWPTFTEHLLNSLGTAFLMESLTSSLTATFGFSFLWTEGLTPGRYTCQIEFTLIAPSI